MTRVVGLILTLLASFSCHIRIINYGRRHNNSYFSHYRQNIVTANQTLTSIYVNIFLLLIRNLIFFSLLHNERMLEFELITIINTIITTVILPTFWLYSTRIEFKELWAEETIFWKKPAQKRQKIALDGDFAIKLARCPYITGVQSLPSRNDLNGVHNSEQYSTIQPRMLHIQETSFIGEGSHPKKS